MPYRTLSEWTQELGQPQQSDTFVQLFRAAVREGRLSAAELPQRFTLPKVNRQGQARSLKDMAFEDTPEAQRWFEETRARLSARPSRSLRVARLSAESVEAGVHDFAALAQATRERLQSRYERGQQLAASRRPGPAPKRGRRKTKTAAKG